VKVPVRFRILAGLLAVGAVFHAATFLRAALSPAHTLDASAWRHLLFVGIDGGFAVALLYRPALLVPALVLFLGQQTSTHGVHVWRQWSAEHSVDWMSVGVLATIAFALAAAVQERRQTPARDTS
jgi:hypothetical protein